MFSRRRFLCTALGATALTATPLAWAHGDISKEFKSMQRALRKMRKARDTEALRDALNTLRQHAHTARGMTPHFLQQAPAEDPRWQQYHDGMDELIAQIDQAIAHTDSGELESARDMLRVLRETRKRFHERFEVDDD